MTKSLLEQVSDLQQQTEILKEYEKALEVILKAKFGYGISAIDKIIKNKISAPGPFESQIRRYFDLNNDTDTNAFIEIMCTDNTRNYFDKRRQNSPTDE